MLTLAEIESTLQIEYELQLESLDEQSLRDLLADTAALRRLAPSHLGDAQMRGIAQSTLVALLARRAPAPEPGAPTELQRAWAQMFTWFWTPRR